MQSITPCQRRISDRFPVASFAVNVPSNRLFEIVCATDPQLLSPAYRGRRTVENFFTSRTDGLLRAPAGQATFLVPPAQLRRFAGRQRMYFALASYGSQRGDDPRLSIPLDHVDHAPSIVLSADFTGRTLDRSRFHGRAQPDGRYGAGKALMTWGGDTIAMPAPAATRAPAARAYDDGFPPDLWRGRDDSAHDAADDRRHDRSAAYPDAAEPPEPDPTESYEEAGHSEAYGRRGKAPARAAASPPARAMASSVRTASSAPFADPPGFEDASALRAASPRYGRVVAATGTEPPGLEDARELASAYGGRSDAGGEPPGAEDGRALAQRFGGRGDAGEPPGAEDGRELVQRYGGRPAGAYAARHAYAYGDDAVIGSPPPAAAAPMPAAPAPAARTVDDDWREEDSEPDLVPPAGERSGDALTIRRKFEIVLPVLVAESGEARYAAVAGSVEYDDPTHAAYQRVHHGARVGIATFTQRSGALGEVLRAWERRDPERFRQHFGAGVADQLLAVTTAASPEARLAPVGGALLWSDHWLDLFRRAGELAPFQAAQNEIALEHYLDRNLGFLAALGLTTDRAIAIVFDRAIHMGLAGARAWILAAVSPITDAATLAQALSATGHVDVAAFQQAAGLAPSGQLGSQTHAALIAALRGRGEQSPLRVPTAAEMLDRIVAVAAGRRFERRLRDLRTSTSFTDAVQRVI